MIIRSTTFNVEHFIVENLDRGLTEKDVVRFYQDQNFNVIFSKDYIKHLKGIKENVILTKINFDKELIEIFKKFENGYPDILIVKDNYLKFVEIKLDGDSVRPNQVTVLEELAKVIPTSLIFFNNFNKNAGRNEFYKITEFTKIEKKIIDQLEHFVKISKIKKLKSLWVVVELYKKFDKKILDKKIVSVISNSIGESKEKIVWFVKTLDTDKKKSKKR
jgi:hypothetical protein